jgi:hypothetical protein
VVQTENGNISTTFTPEQVQLVPNPGNDLSYLVQSAPGAVMKELQSPTRISSALNPQASLFNLKFHVRLPRLIRILWLSLSVAVRSYGSSCLVIHVADGVDHGLRLVELYIFRAIAGEDLF